MRLDPRDETILEILQIRFPDKNRWDIAAFRRGTYCVDWQSITKPPLPETEAYSYFKELDEFSERRLTYFLLLKLAEKSDEEADNRRLDLPSYKLTDKDYDYWCKSDFWHTHEFVALMIGIKPDEIWRAKEIYKPKISEALNEVERLETLVERSIYTRKLDSRSSPRNLLRWAKEKQIEIPDQLRKAAEKYDLFKKEIDELNSEGSIFDEHKNIIRIDGNSSNPTSNLPKQMNTRSRESLLKMVIGMAVGGYAYNPELRRSPTTKEISDDLLKLGLSLDEDTIRSYLKEAKQILPRETAPKPNRKPKSGTL